MKITSEKISLTLIQPLYAFTFATGLFAGESAPVVSNTAAPIAQVKYIPQRKDDIAWENDRIAHRIYGPALEVTEPTGSGIDVWVKSVRYPIIDKWYKAGHYHLDTGEGMDCYGVGHSRGCGGIGIWNGTTLSVSGHWQSYEIKEMGGKRTVFTVNYAPWKLPDGHEVSEKRTFTLNKGTNLNLLESTLTSDQLELIVGIGLAKHKGEVYKNKEKGILAFWETSKPENGALGTAIIVPPQNIVGFAEDKSNNLILMKAKPGVPFGWRTGACWSKGLDFHTFDEWKSYLENEAAAK
jgi:hypothetical protein